VAASKLHVCRLIATSKLLAGSTIHMKLWVGDFFSFKVSKWNSIFNGMNDTEGYSSTCKSKGCEIQATTSTGDNPVFMAKIKIPYSPSRPYATDS
jgi:hypothetical protein